MEQLLADYKKGNVILFVGAGVSMKLRFAIMESIG